MDFWWFLVFDCSIKLLCSPIDHRLCADWPLTQTTCRTWLQETFPNNLQRRGSRKDWLKYLEMRKSENVQNTEVDKQLWPSRSAAHTCLSTNTGAFKQQLAVKAHSWFLAEKPLARVCHKQNKYMFQVHKAQDGLSLCLFCMSSFLTFRVRDLRLPTEPHSPRACLRKPEAHRGHLWAEQSWWPSGPRAVILKYDIVMLYCCWRLLEWEGRSFLAGPQILQQMVASEERHHLTFQWEGSGTEASHCLPWLAIQKSTCHEGSRAGTR